jgi:hypothetical protein
MNFLRRLLGLLAIFSTGAFALEPDIAVTVNQAGEAFIVDVAFDLPVPIATTWDVMTDFDHMSSIVNNLTSSRIVKREGQVLTVRQEGVARYGLFSFAFESEREIRLESLKRIKVKQLSGTTKRMESEARLARTETGTHVEYHAEIVPDSALARMFGASVVRHEIAEQFRAMVAEMFKRDKRANPETVPPTARDLPKS